MSLPEIVGKHCGALLWRRMQITLDQAATNVDTELSQVNRSFGDQPPDDGNMGPSRIMVIPLSPIPAWTNVTHGEPYLLNGTIHVPFYLSGQVPTIINVLMWDPHSYVGPGGAHVYSVNPT